VLEHTSTTIASIAQANAPVIDQAQLEAAQAALVAHMSGPAKVLPIADTPSTRYARWLKLQERVQRNEALAADESNWFDGYAQGTEWESMRTYFENFGLTADQVLTG
jgi:hypothetical protein